MNVRFNALGNRLLALRRRLPPVLYAVDSSTYLCEFDHPGYYNSCTMKSCCFAGDNDEYILSGECLENETYVIYPNVDARYYVNADYVYVDAIKH